MSSVRALSALQAERIQSRQRTRGSNLKDRSITHKNSVDLIAASHIGGPVKISIRALNHFIRPAAVSAVRLCAETVELCVFAGGGDLVEGAGIFRASVISGS